MVCLLLAFAWRWTVQEVVWDNCEGRFRRCEVEFGKVLLFRVGDVDRVGSQMLIQLAGVLEFVLLK